MVSLEFLEFSTLTSRCDWPAYSQTLQLWWTPFKIGHFCPAISIFHLYFPQLWQTSVSKMCMSMTSYLQGGWERIGRISTGNMESLYLLVASLQGSDAGQNILRISGIFNFDVPLWLTRIQSDVATLMDPLQNRTFCPAISIFHLYFSQLWRPVCLNYACPHLHIYRVGKNVHVG